MQGTSVYWMFKDDEPKVEISDNAGVIRIGTLECSVALYFRNKEHLTEWLAKALAQIPQEEGDDGRAE